MTSTNKAKRKENIQIIVNVSKNQEKTLLKQKRKKCKYYKNLKQTKKKHTLKSYNLF
jgi:uncharacterized protein YifE (UPF0438 family)